MSIRNKYLEGEEPQYIYIPANKLITQLALLTLRFETTCCSSVHVCVHVSFKGSRLCRE